MIRIGILGGGGRMGGWVSRLVREEFSERATLSASVSEGDKPGQALDCDVMIDFSRPEAVLGVIREALAKSDSPASTRLPAMVIGSTGWSHADREKLGALARKTPVLMSANFSTGIYSFLEVLKLASPMLKRLGYTPVIVESHHRHKKDAPSGTALTIQQAVEPYQPQSVQTHSIRAGEVIGDHEVIFHGPGDRISLGHFAQDRSIFARGAIDVALWLAEKRETPPEAILGMDDYFREKIK